MTDGLRRFVEPASTVIGSDVGACDDAASLPADDAAAQPFLVDAVSGRVRIGFLLLPGFDLADLSAFTDAFTAANIVLRHKLFSWSLLGLSDAAVPSSADVAVSPGIGLAAAKDIGNLVLLAGDDVERQDGDDLADWLHLASARGRIGAVGAGCLVLAQAGLLAGRRLSLHWEKRSALAETGAAALSNDRIFSLDGGVFTCSGRGGSIDFALYCIARHCGEQVAWAVAERLNCDRVRDGSDLQIPIRASRPPTANAAIRQAVSLIHEDFQRPLDSTDLSRRLGITCRQLQRLFQRHLQTSPRQFSLTCRLEHARELLRQSTMAVGEVAKATGFASRSHFSQCYRRAFGIQPKADRSVNWEFSPQRIEC